MDFGPAIAVSIWLFLLLLNDWLTSRHVSKKSALVLLIGLFSWWAAEVFTADIQPAYRSKGAVNYDEMLRASQGIREYRIQPENFPDEYRLTSVEEHHYGLPFNGDGWDSVSGRTKAAVTLFVRDPQILDLVLAPADDVKLAESDYTIIQAKLASKT